MRLKKDKGINKLVKAAKKFDIFYKNNKDTLSWYIANTILEEKAFDRILSEDPDLLER